MKNLLKVRNEIESKTGLFVKFNDEGVRVKGFYIDFLVTGGLSTTIEMVYGCNFLEEFNGETYHLNKNNKKTVDSIEDIVEYILLHKNALSNDKAEVYFERKTKEQKELEVKDFFAGIF